MNKDAVKDFMAGIHHEQNQQKDDPMQLSEFKHKAVPGLYLYSHFEHENGAFIQVHTRGDQFVFQDVDGTRAEFRTSAALKAHIEG